MTTTAHAPVLTPATARALRARMLDDLAANVDGPTWTAMHEWLQSACDRSLMTVDAAKSLLLAALELAAELPEAQEWEPWLDHAGRSGLTRVNALMLCFRADAISRAIYRENMP